MGVNVETRSISISKQGYFCQRELFDVEYDGDIVASSVVIKKKLDYIYKEKLEKIRLKEVAKNWDGCLDKQSKRDQTLNQKRNSLIN